MTWFRLISLVAISCSAAPFLASANPTIDPFSPLAVYDGNWTVHALHPWSGAAAGAVDQLVSRCRRFTAYFACEQTVDGKIASLIVYTVDDSGQLHTRTIAPDGRAGGRGDLLLTRSHLTYVDKPPASLAGNWSRTENYLLDLNHIRFEEYQSEDEGKTWRMTNMGDETRAHS